jgi:hypothetical protein
MASPPDTALVVANCLSGYPVERAAILNEFGLNQPYLIAVEPVSWGAIKSLYR